MNTPLHKSVRKDQAGQAGSQALVAGAPAEAARPPPGGPAPVVPRLDQGTHSDRTRMVVRVFDFGKGLIEATFGPQVRCQPKKCRRGASDARDENEARAARRAKATLRRKCMAMGADRLLTLTYRENVRDYDRAGCDLSKFLRLLRHEFGDFPYVAVAEPQKRGAVHWHLAIRGFRDARTLRRLWRHAAGDGNIDVSTGGRAPKAGDPLRIARYLSKYLAKGYSEGHLGGLNRKRFRCSKGIVVPEARHEFESLDDSMRFLAGVCPAWGQFEVHEDGLYGWAASW